jgi:hypothetical protein
VRSEDREPIKLYYDRGDDFREIDSISIKRGGSAFHAVTLDLPESTFRLRFDPCSTPGSFLLRDVKLARTN